MSEASEGLVGGRYALGELLGVGGTGSVFAATDRDADDAPVAVKLLHPHLCTDADARAAFLREAARASELRDPHIVRVHGAGLHDAAGVTMPWIALDLLDGPTLRERVAATGPLDPAEAVAVVDDVLAGLALAHAAGIVHRDVSPQNVVLPADGATSPVAARLIDFGLADATGRSTLGGDVLLAGPVAADAGVVGNAAFMSPEQARGLPVRAVSDLYQVGAVLYFALTGRVPFPRATTEQVLRAHIDAPPPVPSALVAAARPFDRVVTRALAKTPAHRFRDAEEFRAALRAAAATVPATLWPSDTTDADRPGATKVLGAGAGGAEAWAAGAGGAGAGGDPLAYLQTLDGTEQPRRAPAHTVPRATGAVAAAAFLAILGFGSWGALVATAEPGAAATPTPTPPAVTTPATVDTPAAPAPASAAPTPEPVASTPQMVAVPTLSGTLAAADSALRDAGLAWGTVSRIESAEPAERILGQNPAAGARVAPGSRIDVTVASGANVVPQVSGMSVAAATAALQSAGFAAVADDAPATATVDRVLPAAGTVLRLGVTVTLTAVPLPTPTPTPSSTPSSSSIGTAP